MLNIFLDNFDDEDQAATSTTTNDPPLSPEAVLPPEPEPRSPEPPRSRWSVAANLNSIATRARQVHQRAGSLQGNVHFDETGTTGRRRVPQASERTTTLLQLSLKSTRRPFPPVLSITAARSHWPMLFSPYSSRSVQWPIRCDSSLGLSAPIRDRPATAP